jgi:endonuclease YncB( thermonuclease family)
MDGLSRGLGRRLRWGAALGLGLLVALMLGCAHSRAQTWQGRVVHVSDGDTVYVRTGHGTTVTIRLLGMDAPEICQRAGEASRDALRAMVLDRRVTVEASGHDSYGRQLARLYLQDRDVGRAMVAQGMAWSYRQGQNPGPYAREQRQAQAERQGLFAQARPEAPRAFRKRHGSCHPGF